MLKKKSILIFLIISFFNITSLIANEKLKIIENINNIETLKFNFVQISFDNKENGICFLKRPHFLKCIYEDKNQKSIDIAKKLFSDGRIHHLVKNDYQENSEVDVLVKEIIKSKSNLL